MPSDFRSPHTVGEALEVLAELGDDAHPLAGGTDLMVQYLRGEVHPEVLLHLGRLDELARIEQNGTVRIGALVTHRRVVVDPTLARGFPALVEASSSVGGRQTQEVGTVAGNVCNASPAADTLPPLLVAHAVVHLASRSGARTVPLEDFILGRRRTARRPDELVTHLEIEPVGAGAAETYLKVAPRTGMEVAVVGLAVRLSLDPDGTVTDARIAATSVAPTPYRAHEAEAQLAGSRLEEAAVAAAGRSLAASASPIDDVRASAAYRRRVLPRLLGRAVTICRQRVEGA